MRTEAESLRPSAPVLSPESGRRANAAQEGLFHRLWIDGVFEKIRGVGSMVLRRSDSPGVESNRAAQKRNPGAVHYNPGQPGLLAACGGAARSGIGLGAERRLRWCRRRDERAPGGGRH